MYNFGLSLHPEVELVEPIEVAVLRMLPGEHVGPPAPECPWGEDGGGRIHGHSQTLSSGGPLMSKGATR